MKCWDEIEFDDISIYKSIDGDRINYGELERFLSERTGKDVTVRENIFNMIDENIEEKIARCRVRSRDERESRDPLPAEVNVERRINDGKDIFGILYDGEKLSRLLREIIPDIRDKHVIVIMKRLVGTLDNNDNRYHARTVLCSIPSLISLPGIVEGPAKPKEYYLEGRDEDLLDFDPLTYEDDRMTEAVKSYALQTVFWRSTGEPFCDNEGCRLYNSHWQREVIKYQINGELCDKHKSMLEEYV